MNKDKAILEIDCENGYIKVLDCPENVENYGKLPLESTKASLIGWLLASKGRKMMLLPKEKLHDMVLETLFP